MREREIERKLRQKTESHGGRAIKMAGEIGMPDRLLLFPGGKMAFAETKTETGRLSPRQKYVIDILRALGFTAEVIRTDDDIDRIIGDTLKKDRL